METQPTGYVSVPGLDFTHYFNQFVSFLSAHGIDLWILAKGLVGFIITITIPLSIFFIFAIIITMESLKKVRAREDEMFNQPPAEAKKEEKVHAEQAKRWRKVVEHVESNNQNDWKQAIIEADVMLEQLLTNLGYRGESIGEKLKRATKGDFKTLDQAWEAHKVRNRIAHDGSSFDINQIEAKQVIGLYRQVFDEFYHISS
jgi:hypothetical protein